MPGDVVGARVVTCGSADAVDPAPLMLVSLGEALEDAGGDADRLRDALGASSAAVKALDTPCTGRTWPGYRSLIDMGRDASEAPRRGRGPTPP